MLSKYRPVAFAAAGLVAFGLSAGTSLAGSPATVSVKLTGNRCTLSATSVKAGPVTFDVTNVSSTSITEVELQQNLRIVGERENLAPGLPTATFTVTLDGGSYTIYCPGGRPENQTFTVTGKAAPTPGDTAAQVLAAGTKTYAKWVIQQAEAMNTEVGKLKKAVDGGNIKLAKQYYVLARPFYEKIESDVDGFVLPGFRASDNAGNLDYLIDMRASNLDPRVGWTGFHAIERDLYKRGTIDTQTRKRAGGLKSHVKELVKVVKGLTYKPEDLGNGAADLLDEVQATKVTGEEENFSHIDLVDMSANIEGAQQAFADLQPGLQKIDPSLARTVDGEFAKVRNALNEYIDDKAPGGYIPWTTANRKKYARGLSQTVLGLQQPLQQIAAKVATAE